MAAAAVASSSTPRPLRLAPRGAPLRHHVNAPAPVRSRRPRLAVSASAGAEPETSGSGRFYFNFTGFPFPLGPFLNRRTIRTEAVKGSMWLFEQEQALGFSSVSTNIRMTIVKLKSGGLWVHAPIAPTKECIQLLKELDAPVEHIVLPTFAYEHKIFVGPFSRKFPAAQIWVAPRQWSWPINLPLEFFGIFRAKPLKDEDDSTPWAAEIEQKVLSSPEVGIGPYVEVAFYHKPSRTLLVTDAVIFVPRQPPECISKESLLASAKNGLAVKLLSKGKEVPDEPVIDNKLNRQKVLAAAVGEEVIPNQPSKLEGCPSSLEGTNSQGFIKAAFMGSSLEDELRQNLVVRATEPEDLAEYTGDGSVDFRGLPILKHNTGNWRACSLILGTEVCERLAYYGISKSLVTYLSTRLHEGNVSAARNFTTWQGTCYLTPLIGATLADSYWGKYRTIAVFSTIYFLGMAALTLSASVPSFKPPQCFGSICPEPTLPQYLIYFVGLYMIALGAGGIKPCVSSFGADQFDDTDPVEKTKKGSFFNWFYFCINIGSLISGTVLIWVQENYGYGIGFGIPTFFIVLAIGSFFIGSEIYRFQIPGGSPLTRTCQVVVAATCKRKADLPIDSSLLFEIDGKTSAIEGSRKLEHSSEFSNVFQNYKSFLDKAAVILWDEHDSSHDPWRLCTVTQVEELKILLRMFPIWATGIVFFTVCAQNSSMFIEQGMALNGQIGSFKIPPATLSSLDVISIVVWVPIYERFVVPIARRFTGKERGFSELQRMGIGLFVSTIAVAVAALVEIKRLQVARAEDLVHQKVPVPMGILWQAPQYLLVGVGEVFTSIGQAEFFYNQSPDAMRSLSSAFALVTVSLGSYLSSFILTLVSYFTTRNEQLGWIPDNLNEGHLDRFFWLIAGLSFLNLLVFIYYAQKYKYKKASVA